MPLADLTTTAAVCDATAAEERYSAGTQKIKQKIIMLLPYKTSRPLNILKKAASE